jgi:hypothetical protein
MEPQPPSTPQQPPVAGWQPPQGGSPSGSWEGPNAYPPAPGRPGQVTAAAIVLMILGVLIGLLGLLFLLFAAMFSTIVNMQEFRDQFGDVSESAGGIIAAFGFLFVADGLLQFISGIFILPGRSWARITGLIAGILGALIVLVGVLPGQGGGGGNLFFLVLLVGYVYVVMILITHGDWFRR